MSKHTAGPWKVGSKFEVGKVSDADDQSFGMIDPLADVYGDNKEADSRLIAAAPDLLEAIQKIQFRLECFIEDDRDMRVPSLEVVKSICDEAIAKALAQ